MHFNCVKNKIFKWNEGIKMFAIFMFVKLKAFSNAALPQHGSKAIL